MTKVCGVPSCKAAPVGACRWRLRKKYVNPDTGEETITYAGEACGLLRCLHHVQRGADGTALCLWHKHVEEREAKERAAARGAA